MFPDTISLVFQTFLVYVHLYTMSITVLCVNGIKSGYTISFVCSLMPVCNEQKPSRSEQDCIRAWKLQIRDSDSPHSAGKKEGPFPHLPAYEPALLVLQKSSYPHVRSSYIRPDTPAYCSSRSASRLESEEHPQKSRSSLLSYSRHQFVTKQSASSYRTSVKTPAGTAAGTLHE